MEADLEKEPEISHKISQTMFPVTEPVVGSASLVNSRVYSPLPFHQHKHSMMSPAKLRKMYNYSNKRKYDSGQFKLPGVAADIKELISPFSMRTKDYANLYINYSMCSQKYVNFPSIRPKYVQFKGVKRLKKTENPENIASKKELTVRKHKKDNSM